MLAFYTSTSKQVLDIHEEARRIASQHQSDTPVSTATGTAAPPVAPAVHSTDKPLADETKTSTTEAPAAL